MSVFLLVPNGLAYCSFKEVLKSGRISSLILFFLKVALLVLKSESESCSVVSDSLSLQIPLFIEFSRQEYWSR